MMLTSASGERKKYTLDANVLCYIQSLFYSVYMGLLAPELLEGARESGATSRFKLLL